MVGDEGGGAAAGANRRKPLKYAAQLVASTPHPEQYPKSDVQMRDVRHQMSRAFPHSDDFLSPYLLTYGLNCLSHALPRCLPTPTEEADGGGGTRLTGRSDPLGRRLEYTDNPRTTAVDRRSTPSARADRQDPLPMFRCPGHARTTIAPAGSSLIT